jgi:hypothetical protein
MIGPTSLKPQFGISEPEGDIFYLIRTCNRKESTLDETLQSLKNVGVDNPYIFIDSVMEGSFKPFVDSCNEVISKHHGWVLLCEDDVIFCKSAIEILKKTKFNLNQTASLWCSSKQSSFLRHKGWNKMVYLDWHGSLAYFIHTDNLRRIIDSKIFKNWNKKDRVDSAWVLACKSLGIEFLMHHPSLVQHIGLTSTIDNGRKLSSGRTSTNWSQDY